MSPLPVDDVLEELLGALARHRAAVLLAPPGAGKTTRVPPALLRSDLIGGGRGILVLQPRRVAARAAARRIAAETGTRLGDTVGYHVRFDRVGGDATPIMVLTEGILTRRLQADPFLEGVGAVILDEFHERSLHADLALALLADVRRQARPDLLVAVMSATLDPEPVARFLDAPVVRAEGREHPIEISYQRRPDDRRIEDRVASAVRQELDRPGGDVLVFLPGAGEIARSAERLEGLGGAELIRLHGDMAADRQDAALSPGARRRVILATNVAETSLTIPGVRTVVDSGLVRRLVHDSGLGLDRLELGRVSRASADQRAGRAGREAPGRAVRLWTRLDDRVLDDHEEPEIRRVDLASCALELLAWGVRHPLAFGWFEPPPKESVGRALALLERLGAATPAGGGWRLTEVGKSLVTLPLHPRLGRMLLEARRLGCTREGAALAALCSERDILTASRPFSGARRATHVGPSDLLVRLDGLAAARDAGFARDACHRAGVRAAAARRVDRAARQLERLAGRAADGAGGRRDGSDAALLRTVLAGFPDRVARRRAERSAEAVMVGGRGLALDDASVVSEAPLLVAVVVEAGRRGRGSASRVRLASAIEEPWLSELFPGSVATERTVTFDEQAERVVGVARRRYLDLVLDERLGVDADPAEVASELERALRRHADRVRPDDGELARLMARVDFLREHVPELELPVIDEERRVEVLASMTAGRRSFDELRRVPLAGAVLGMLTHDQRRALAAEAPEQIVLPSGRRAGVRYEAGRPPVLSARVQQLFGLDETPRLARGRVPCLVEILAPNGRPVQLTQDLASFWGETYARVRRDLRGRYPKHDWPERPW